MEQYENLELAMLDDGVMVASLNRPDSLNALNASLHRELARFFAGLASDHDVRCLVLTGKGRAFCAGGDLRWIRDEVPVDPEVSFREAKKIVVDLLNVPQPIVAAVNGPAAGFGLTMALMCDFSYVEENAPLSDPHVPVGLVAGDGGAIVWPLLTGMVKAKRYLLTGDTLLGSEAARIGLVTEACPSGEVLPRAMAMAKRMAALPRYSVEGTKRTLNALLNHVSSLSLDLGLSAERVAQASPEHAAIINAMANARSRAKVIPGS